MTALGRTPDRIEAIPNTNAKYIEQTTNFLRFFDVTNGDISGMDGVQVGVPGNPKRGSASVTIRSYERRVQISTLGGGVHDEGSRSLQTKTGTP